MAGAPRTKPRPRRHLVDSKMLMGGAPPRSAQYGGDEAPRQCHLEAGSSSMLPSVYTAVRSITNTHIRIYIYMCVLYIYKYIDDVIHNSQATGGGRRAVVKKVATLTQTVNRKLLHC